MWPAQLSCHDGLHPQSMSQSNPILPPVAFVGIFITETGQGRGTQVLVKQTCCPCSRTSLLSVSWGWPLGADWMLGRSLAQHFLCLLVASSSILSPGRHWNLTIAARVTLSLFPRLGWKPSPSMGSVQVPGTQLFFLKQEWEEKSPGHLRLGELLTQGWISAGRPLVSPWSKH